MPRYYDDDGEWRGGFFTETGEWFPDEDEEPARSRSALSFVCT